MKEEAALKGKRIMVTGASGFIGAHLCTELLKLGCRVDGVCRDHPGALAHGVIAHRADLSDAAQAKDLMERVRPDVLFHLAGCVTGSRELDLVRPTFEANVSTTLHLLEAVARNGCDRFVLTGSLEEPDPVEAPPSSPYAASKSAATAYARMFHALYEVPSVIARVFMVYGPDQKDERKLVPYVIRSLLAGERPRLSSGTRLVDWIYVDDVVQGLLRLAVVEGLGGKTLDLGTGELESVRFVVERLASLVGSDVPLRFDAGADRPMEQVRAADVAETEALPGWRPRHSLEEGLRATLAWHRARQASARGDA